MTLTQFVQINGLKQADAIILRKKIIGMVDHYAVFLGFRNNMPVFVANYRDGVKEVSAKEMNEVLQTLEPVKIDPFPGNENERPIAVKRAMSRIGEKAYNYVSNNCEHFKNWVHFGENKSSQVKIVGNISTGMAVGLGIITIASKNKSSGVIILIGLLLILGFVLRTAAED